MKVGKKSRWSLCKVVLYSCEIAMRVTLFALFQAAGILDAVYFSSGPINMCRGDRPEIHFQYSGTNMPFNSWSTRKVS